MKSFIHLGNLSKRFGGVVAVNETSLIIGSGEFFSLLGPSGCGKTTLLRMIGGFVMPDSGTIHIDGENVSHLPPNKRPTNMVFQSYAIFPHLNVRDNIAYGLRSEGVPPAERDRRVEEALALIKLGAYGNRRANELSGGERQRVALARALVKRPKVLLLDEPLGALDKRLRDAMQAELRELQRSLGITFLFVTHDQDEALSMSDRIAVMEKGEILQVADPRTLYEAPASRAVAEFIGAMNFFEGRIVSGGATILAETRALGPIEAPARPGLAPGMAVTAAIRPERLALSKQRLPGPCVEGLITGVSYFGERYHFQAAISGADKPVLAAAQNTQDAGSYAPGDAVFLAWKPESVVLLPG